jgi:hypothetical protein
MARDTDPSNTIAQVFMDLVVPRLEKLKADIRLLEKHLETWRSPSSRYDAGDSSVPPSKNLKARILPKKPVS